jgi:hypothetical protein
MSSTELKVTQGEDGDSIYVDFSSKHEGPLKEEISSLIDAYSQNILSSKQIQNPVHVDEIASGLARFYEKIRKVIDWKDDNALRRGSIERILKRTLFPKMLGFSSKKHDPKTLAKSLTIELIRGGHLSNHTVPQERVDLVAQALKKYLFFWEYILENENVFEVKKTTVLTTFVLEIAACEIEELLTNPVKEIEMIDTMAKLLEKRIAIKPENALSPEKKFEAVKVSVQRALYHLDDKYIVYKILQSRYSDWHNPSQEEMKKRAKSIGDLKEKLYKEIHRKSQKKFDVIAEKVNTVFLLLDDVLSSLKEEPEEIQKQFEDKENLIELVEEAYEKRRGTLKTRLIKLAIFSTLSVFLANLVAFYVIEVPIANFFYGGFSVFAILVDLLLPTSVTFFLVIFIKPPREGNLQKVLDTMVNFVYKDQEFEEYKINLSKKKRTSFHIFLRYLYLLTALLVFGGIAYIFYMSKLPITSVIYNTLTIPLAVFAAVVIRNKAKELNVGEESNLRDLILDIVTVPVAKVGSILARKWKEYNVISIFFNFLIEIPLVAIFDFIQAWNKFIKDRKSELD